MHSCFTKGKLPRRKRDRLHAHLSMKNESSVGRVRVPSSPHQKTDTSDHQPMGGLVLFFKPLGLSFIVQCLLKTSDIKTPDNNRFHRAPTVQHMTNHVKPTVAGTGSMAFILTLPMPRSGALDGSKQAYIALGVRRQGSSQTKVIQLRLALYSDWLYRVTLSTDLHSFRPLTYTLTLGSIVASSIKRLRVHSSSNVFRGKGVWVYSVHRGFTPISTSASCLMFDIRSGRASGLSGIGLKNTWLYVEGFMKSFLLFLTIFL